MRALLVAWCVAAASAGGLIGVAAASPAGEGRLVASPRFVPAAGPLAAGDGRVAWVSRRDDRVLDLWVAQIGAPPRRVQRFSGSDAERLRRPRLVVSATEVGLELTVVAPRRVTVRAYAGAVGRPLAPVGRLSFESARDVGAGAVWVARVCAGAEIRAAAISTAAHVGTREPRCPLRLRRAVTRRRDRLRLGVSCAGFAIDCAAHVTVRAAGRVIARGPARYNHATPPYAAADLRLTPAGVRLLRRHPHARLRIGARIAGAQRVRTAQTFARRNSSAAER
jgi:hypothetical protein